MLYFILLIILLTLFLYFIYKDYLKILKITSIVTVSSGIFTFVIGYFVKYFINNNLGFINISKVTNIIISEFVFNGICLLIIGLIEFTCYFVIDYFFSRSKVVNV